MDFVHFGVGPAATLTGFLLFGLSAGAAPVEESCTPLVGYTFDDDAPPFYPVANQPGYWHTDVWPGGHPAPTAGFPDLVLAFGAEIIDNELSYLDDNPRQAAAVFANADPAGAGILQSLVDTYGGLTKIYVEIGKNFHAAIFEEQLIEPARLLTVYPLSFFYESFSLLVEDNDGPPTGELVLTLRWWGEAQNSTTVATKPRTWADGLHVIRVEMIPSTPLFPGSTTNPTLVANGVARVYIDDVLEYEDTAIKFKPNPAPIAQINDCFDVGGVGLGRRGFLGGYTYLDFGYCTVDEPPEPPVPPTPGGEAPEGEEPPDSPLPVGVTRIFALLTYGTDSPQSKRKFTETPFFFDPPEWYGGYGFPWLISVGDIVRELSDSVKGTEVTVRFADPEYFFRNLGATEPLAGATLEIFLVADEVRYALGEPHRRFAGIVHDFDALPGMEFELIVRDVVSEELGRLGDAPVIPPDRLNATKFPGMTKDYENRAVPIALGEVSDEDAINPQGVVPPLIVAPSMNLTSFGGVNVPVVGAILSHGALPPNGLWKGYYNPISNPYARIPIPAGAWGTILTAPGQAGWSYVGVDPDNFIDYPADPTLTHRYTPVFFLRDDPNVQAFLDGRIQVAFNVYGVTDEPDGSGLYFADAPDIYEFLLSQYLYPPHWRYGAYNLMPTFVGGYSFISHASIVKSRNTLRSFLGSPGAYPVGFLLGRDGQQQTLRHVLHELCDGVLMEQGIDRHGRIVLGVEDVNAPSTLHLSDLLDIADGFRVKVDRGSYRNNAEYQFGYRYLPAVAPLPAPPEGETLPPANVGEHTDWSSVATHLHDDAITANRGKLSPPMKLQNYVVRNSDVAVNWVQRKIAQVVGPGPGYNGQHLFTLQTSWQALSAELDDVIDFDHFEGMANGGYIGQRGRILKITDNLQEATITIEGRVLFSEGSPS